MKKAVSLLLIMILMTTVAAALASCGDKAVPDAGKETEESKAAEELPEEESGEKDNAEEDDAKEEEKVEVNTDNITVNTQSSIRIEGTYKVYFDPYKVKDTPHDADLILITHAHYDHFDPPSLRNVAGDKTLIVCPDSMYNDVKSLGVVKDLAVMEPGAEISPENDIEGISIEAVQAYNLNKTFHPKANGWLGYILTMDGVRYYAAGDTDALPELEDVKCDVAFVPIGGTYTMTATEAAGLINKIKPEYVIPIHYGTIVGKSADADTFKAAVDDGIKVVTKVQDAK